MLRIIVFISMLLLFAPMIANAEEGKPDLYVAPNGNDAWSGSLPTPNRGKTDGPLATLDRARVALRERRTAGKHVGSWKVQVRGGIYSLKEPLVFTGEDSGTQDAPVIYEAAPGEKVVLSGGTTLSGWTQERPGSWSTNLPDVQSGKWNFVQLWANEERRYRPRLPKQGFYHIADAMPPSAKAAGKGYDRFKFTGDEIRSDWSNISDVEVLCFQIWTMARMRIENEGVDKAEKSVTFTGDTHSLAAYHSLPKGNRYLVENVKEALSEPGEWYLDRPTGKLTYIAMKGENPGKSGFALIAPRLAHLVEIKGEKGKLVEYLTFRGITFAYTNWVTPPAGNLSVQAEVNQDGALTLRGARNCVFEGCDVAHTGNYGIEMGEGCSYNRIENCLFTDLGAGGIKIGTQGIPADNGLVASNNQVRNCIITQGGRLHPAGIGIWVGQSPYNKIEHNLIADLYYSGLSIGWTWGYGKSLAHDNQIVGNRVMQIGQGVLSDMGGIYTLGLSPGSLVEGNVFSHIVSFGYGGWGIYFDEGTTDMVARNNLVYRTKTGGFHQHYGKNNVVTNNIFAFSEQGQLIRTRQEEHLSFSLEHNIILFDEGSLLGSNWSDPKGFHLDNNLYWQIPTVSGTGKPLVPPKNPKEGKPEPGKAEAGKMEPGSGMMFAGKTFADWQKTGQDAHSLIVDPQFENPGSGDFRLKAGSPVAKIGFQPFDYAQAGPVLGNGDARRSEQICRWAREIIKVAEKGMPVNGRAFPRP